MRHFICHFIQSAVVASTFVALPFAAYGQAGNFGGYSPNPAGYPPAANNGPATTGPSGGFHHGAAAPGYLGEQSVWAATFRQAQRMAAERRRLVLIHFWDDNCAPCRSVERNVFSLPEVERALSINYVPVRVNVSDEPELAQRYNVTRWPTDIVVTPEGIEVFRATSEQDPNRYIAFLDRVATHARVGTTPPRNPGEGGPTNETTNVANSARDDQGFVPRNYEDQLLANRERLDNAQRSMTGALQNGLDRRSPLDRPPQDRWQMPPADMRNGNFDPQDNPFARRDGGYSGNLAGAAGGNSPPPAAPSGNPPANYSPNNGGFEGRPAANQWAQNGTLGSDPRLANSPTSAPNFIENRRPNTPPGMQSGNIAPDQGLATTPPAGPRANPSIALDGYCAVTLTEQKKWKKADSKFGAIHRDRTYLFAGPEEQQRFLANPDRYSPMLSGYDPVRYAEQGQLVEGKRSHGLTIGDQMYLFSDEASLQQFWKQPQSYIRVVQEAMRAPAGGNVQR